jgi:hypothetical protein
VSGSHVSFDGVGSCVIDADQAAGGNYTAASQVRQTLTVGRARLTVTADDRSKRFGTANPPLTATITGFVHGDTLATSGVSGSPVCTTTATAASPGGRYTIECARGTLAAANYSFAFADGTLTVSYTRTITGDFRGKLAVGAGQSVLLAPGSTLIGPLTVERGGALVVNGAAVLGLVTSTGATAIRVCNSTITGLTTVLDSSGLVVFGDDAGCAGNELAGAVTLVDNKAGVEFVGNRVRGALTIIRNTGAIHVARNTTSGGPVTIQHG